jgi:hypothetical protein
MRLRDRALLGFVILLAVCFAALFLYGASYVVYSLVFGTLMQMAAGVIMLGAGYYGAIEFKRMAVTFRYNLALSELFDANRNGKPISKGSERILRESNAQITK